ncbi:MAG: excinuclease ABC subunit UvrA [Candidatus Dojkabacteria bacterium]|nr:MAG: excinuclease ABC subunit UvrA [Candidatus Dojkabacteria bacterium]
MAADFIEIVGARENNLRNVNLSIPKRKISIFTGVSGSGKSSIVFDTIAQEAGRQLNETFSNMARLFLPRYSQPEADSIENLSMVISVDQKRLGGNARSTLGTISDINSLLRLLFSRFADPHIGYANSYSFNDPAGMCMECQGIGKIITLDINAAVDQEKSLNEGAILLPGYKIGGWPWKMIIGTEFFDADKKIKDYSEEELHKLMYAKAEKIKTKALDFNMTYEGLVERFMRSNLRAEKDTDKEKMEKYTIMGTCPVCKGKRLNETTLNSKLNGYSIHDLTEFQINELIAILKGFNDETAQPIVNSIIQRLQNLVDIGLEYLSLNRETSTLSGGESQRVKMVKHLSSSLSDVCYIFDEPSIGLHSRDIHRLNELLEKLRDKGNTVIVVEHDPNVMRIADAVFDIGPKAGTHGGEVVYSGTFAGLKQAETLTGQCLREKFALKSDPRKSDEFFETEKSSLHNLKNVSLRIPKGVFTVVTGVAGSGKSTLVNHVFATQFPDVIRVDQSAVNANIRSNPATYAGIMDDIRKAFASENSVSAGLFSYNSEGACEKCKGIGTVEINLSFMDKAEVTCDVCGGKRYKQEVLHHLYREKNIIEVMDMTIADAAEFFEQKEIVSKLRDMVDVGLHYMTLGQPLNTLSGGECQRLKLAKELRKKGNIYILDEPTTGLHMSDIKNILTIITKLVESGNTVVTIEHNMDIIKNADWIIDLGPEGGNKGGEILFEGTPTDLLKNERSLTAEELRESLEG